MSHNGQQNGTTQTQALTWSRRVLSAHDLQKHLNGHREIILPLEAVVTPLASEELRGRGIPIRRNISAVPVPGPIWGYGQDRPHPMVVSAVQTLHREGLALREMPAIGDLPCRWAQAVAECLARGECAGSVLFCEQPELVACVANKVPGLRAVSVNSVGQAARATLLLAANLLVVEMPGRTFFEIRHILRLLCTSSLHCPEGVAGTLRELENSQPRRATGRPSELGA